MALGRVPAFPRMALLAGALAAVGSAKTTCGAGGDDPALLQVPKSPGGDDPLPDPLSNVSAPQKSQALSATPDSLECCDVPSWYSRTSWTCSTLEYYQYCGKDKIAGKWEWLVANRPEYAESQSGVSAAKVCCGCGGGKSPCRDRCRDTPPGWYNSIDAKYDCPYHASFACRGGGVKQSHLDFVRDNARDGVSAGDACCACGGGERCVPEKTYCADLCQSFGEDTVECGYTCGRNWGSLRGIANYYCSQPESSSSNYCGTVCYYLWDTDPERASCRQDCGNNFLKLKAIWDWACTRGFCT